MKKKNTYEKVMMAPNGELFLYVDWYSDEIYGNEPRERIVSFAKNKIACDMHKKFFKVMGFKSLGPLDSK